MILIKKYLGDQFKIIKTKNILKKEWFIRNLIKEIDWRKFYWKIFKKLHRNKKLEYYKII